MRWFPRETDEQIEKLVLKLLKSQSVVRSLIDGANRSIRRVPYVSLERFNDKK